MSVQSDQEVTKVISFDQNDGIFNMATDQRGYPHNIFLISR